MNAYSWSTGPEKNALTVAWFSPRAIALEAAALISFFWTLRFPTYLPITDGWTSLERLWFPLSAIDTAFHEAGHFIFGILGIDFLRVAGGTLMQLLMPAACLVHFLRQKSIAGAAFAIWWIGLNLVEISWYAADAKLQALVLITGLSGREGGGHDWGYMLEAIGLLNHSVGVGQLFFFSGVWILFAVPFLAITLFWKRSVSL